MSVNNHVGLTCDRTFKPVTGVRIPLGSSPLPSEISEEEAAGAVKNGHSGPPQSHHGRRAVVRGGALLGRVSPEPNSGCWLWLGSLDGKGYGVFGRHGRTVLAHRAVVESLRGPIADGLTLDHLCRVRSCVNPAHLEAVAMRVNVLRGQSPAAINARKDHCSKGHSLAGARLEVRPAGGVGRRCRECDRLRKRAERAAREVLP